MITLTVDELECILEHFKDSDITGSYEAVWSKRKYAPMLIHSSKMRRLKDDIEKKFPAYTITFDVIFSCKGNEVNWHTDYESLGPFINNSPFQAICNRDFISVHFNLTEEGGRLSTLEWCVLSYINYLITLKCGIFSRQHEFFVKFVVKPLAYMFSIIYTNTSCVGNVFNNLGLHYVSDGRERISYVVRMAKSEIVETSKACVELAIVRSKNCSEFTKFLDVVPETPSCVGVIPWQHTTYE